MVRTETQVDQNNHILNASAKYQTADSNINGANTSTSKTKIWTLAELNQEETKKKYSWIILDRKVYNISTWMKKHPGGDLILQHYLYKDASDEYRVYHPEFVSQKILPNFQIGVLADSEVILTDSKLAREFRDLFNKLHSNGFFENKYGFYILEGIKCLSLLFLSIWFIMNNPTNSAFIVIIAAFFMAAFWQQLAFVGHDLGHNGVTGIMEVDHFIGILVGNFFGAISIGWWKDNHNVHHVVTNDPEHDPDIQHLPFLAVTSRLFNNLYSSYYERTLKFDGASKTFIKLQHYLFYVIMFFGKYNLLAQSLLYITTNRRTKYRIFELLSILAFLAWYSLLVSRIETGLNRLIFIILSNGITALLHVQITISHFAMCTEARGDKEEFFRHQLRTTMDVDCSTWMDWLHGGLQFQVVHHLFPRMPRRNLREASKLVLEMSNKYNIDYRKYDFIGGNIYVLGHLKKVASEVDKLHKE